MHTHTQMSETETQGNRDKKPGECRSHFHLNCRRDRDSYGDKEEESTMTGRLLFELLYFLLSENSRILKVAGPRV